MFLLAPLLSFFQFSHRRITIFFPIPFQVVSLQNPMKYRPRISIVLPMRNEKNIVRKLNEMISMDYPSELVSLIVIDSTSSDNTGQVGRDYLESMEPKLSWQIHRIEKPGKSLAVNFAINLIDSEIFIISDADSHCRSDALAR